MCVLKLDLAESQRLAKALIKATAGTSKGVRVR
jgi:hypothetical protein